MKEIQYSDENRKAARKGIEEDREGIEKSSIEEKRGCEKSKSFFTAP